MKLLQSVNITKCCRIHGLKTYEGCDVHEFVNDKLAKLGITGVESKDIVNVYTDYIGMGYSGNHPYELGMLNSGSLYNSFVFIIFLKFRVN